MKFTLLEGVQEVLSSMDSDEVDSIDDTVESFAVALIFKSVYYDIVNDLGLIESDSTFSLIASTDTAQPVLMTVPENVTRVNWIKYDNKTADETNATYLDVRYKQFDEFLMMQQALVNETSNVASMDVLGSNDDTYSVMYWTNKMPQWYTVYDNTNILFDSLDTDIDTTLQQSKVLCHGRLYPTWEMVDEYQPVLDPSQYRFYLQRCKIRAHAELKQQAHQEAVSEARRQKIITQKRKHRVNTKAEIFNNNSRYGRK
jgi:hypothetical protein